MKAKVADLKTHLSRYLRRVRDTGESIEVCVREQPVAYLSPAPGGAPDAAEARAAEALRRRLLAAGLTLAPGSAGPGIHPTPKASVAGDRRTDVATVSALRAAKDW